MRAMRLIVAIGALVALAVTGTLPAGAGAGNGSGNPNWFNEPVEGPSPNTSHIVGNTDGGECGIELQPASFGRVVLGGPPPFAPGVAAVQLRDPDTDAVLHEQLYEADPDGDWGASSDDAGETGIFPIPGGLDPDVYPLTAQCLRGPEPEPTPTIEALGLVVLGGLEPIFTYADRSYTVIAQTRPRDPEDVEPTFTG